MKEQKKLYNKRVYGEDLANYLLFDGLSYDGLNDMLRKIYQKKGFEKVHNFTVHDLRHTASSRFCFEIAEGQVSIISTVLGHSREEITLKYLHLHDKMNTKEDIKSKVDDLDDLDIDDIKAV